MRKRLRFGGLTGTLVAAAALLVAVPPASSATVPRQQAVGDVALYQPLQDALTAAAAKASDESGIITFACVMDRSNGKVIAQTDNARDEVSSESLVKAVLAAYYLVTYKGKLPDDLNQRLHRMIEVSDDDLASGYWTDAAVPTIAERYRLTTLRNYEPDPGMWGKTQISACGMASFLYQASHDPLVGPWLISAMQDSADTGGDGFDQNFGFNAIAGTANKEGWGVSDGLGELTGRPNIHTMGLTDRYVGVVLQSGPEGVYQSMRPYSTATVQSLLDVDPPPAPKAGKSWWAGSLSG
ncbi:hypothetical protein [Nakamurella aerolata]|uniref:Beta-lactamase family protein n=1 Tax=Nakamurella aerolata TaxID=1656892 RepID=A0A849AGS3_9ACTN|nr:hypothetical protein [Nakamurella aerolata]NNG36042.1 hypothetical protein [Nakamurella aerolata]